MPVKKKKVVVTFEFSEEDWCLEDVKPDFILQKLIETDLIPQEGSPYVTIKVEGEKPVISIEPFRCWKCGTVYNAIFEVHETKADDFEGDEEEEELTNKAYPHVHPTICDCPNCADKMRSARAKGRKKRF